MFGRKVDDGGAGRIDAVWDQLLPWQEPVTPEPDGDTSTDPRLPDTPPTDEGRPEASEALPRPGTRMWATLILVTAAAIVIAVIVALGPGSSPAPSARAGIDPVDSRPPIRTSAAPTATASAPAPVVGPVAPGPSPTGHSAGPGPTPGNHTPGTHRPPPATQPPTVTPTTHPTAPGDPSAKPTAKPSPPPAPASVEVSGQLSCDSGHAIVGVWVEAAKGSGFASWRGLGDGSTADYWIFLPAALPYSLNVGCGGSSSSWNQSVHSGVFGTTHNSFNCDDVPGTADYKVCVHR